MTGGRMTLMFTLFLTGAVGLLCWIVYDLGHTAGSAEVREAWEVQKAADAQANAKAAQEAREVEAGLLRHIDEIRRSHENNIAAIYHRHDVALGKLRKRTSRPDNYVPAAAEITGAEPVAGCGADRLWREDAEVALGIARDADITRAALMECRSTYEAAQRANEGKAGP